MRNTPKEDYPFIYIAALMRTGSTVLSEALTQMPYSFIFREPHLGKNYFALKPTDAKLFGKEGIDLEAFTKRHLPLAFFYRRLRIFGYPQDYILRMFKNKVMLQLNTCTAQLGVKEIKNQGWENYKSHFPNMRTLITGRDPRDIYISFYHLSQKGGTNWQGPVSPENVANELLKQFQLQRQIYENTKSLLVRYEDLCTDTTIYDKIKSFVNSPIPAIGSIGAFNATHKKRADEYLLHGQQITDQRINRWQRETNEVLRAEAQRTFDIMSEYTSFWGYE